MRKHEIEIEGILPEYEIVGIRCPLLGEQFLGPRLSNGNFQINTCKGFVGSEPRVIVKLKVRKYDWKKTLDDVLTESKHSPGIFVLKKQIPFLNSIPCEGRVVASIWQPNIHGKCPVDPEASIVRVRFNDGSEAEGLALGVWETYDQDTIRAWKFIRLVDGVEW